MDGWRGSAERRPRFRLDPVLEIRRPKRRGAIWSDAALVFVFTVAAITLALVVNLSILQWVRP